MKIYSVRDVNVGWNQPFCEMNDDVAIRGFSYAVNNSDIMGFSPQDFDLYCLGEFESKTGEISAEIPCLIVHGSEVIQK